MLFGKDQAATMVAEVEAVSKPATQRPSFAKLVKTLNSELRRASLVMTHSRRDLLRKTSGESEVRLTSSLKNVMSVAVERHQWTRYEAFRLIALWAKTSTAHIMEDRVKTFLQDAHGALLLDVADVTIELEQPLLRHADAISIADLISEDDGSFHADLDQRCFPELLKALSTAAYDELEAHLRSLMPGSHVSKHDKARKQNAIATPAEMLAVRIDVDDDCVRRHVVSEDACESCAAFGDFFPDFDYTPTIEYDDLDKAVQLNRTPGGAPASPDGEADADDAAPRCKLKCARGVSIKSTARMGAKVEEYEREKGPGRFPYAAFIGDSLRASFVCKDAETFHATWCALLGNPDDPNQKFKVLRLKNKIAKNVEPFNFHINASFQPSNFKAPILIEVQIWINSVMALNEVAHWQYEVARAKRVMDF